MKLAQPLLYCASVKQRNGHPRWRLILIAGAALVVLLGVGGWFAFARLQPTEIGGNTTEEYIASTTTTAATTRGLFPRRLEGRGAFVSQRLHIGQPVRITSRIDRGDHDGDHDDRSDRDALAHLRV